MMYVRFRCLAVALGFFSWLAASGHAQLQITEFLYDTRSSEPDWEWIELQNTGAADIDLDGYFLDDRSTAAGRTTPNILSLANETTVNTIVPAGQTAVIYNGDALGFDESRFRNAWGLSNATPLIGVDGWQALNNGGDGDAFGLWDSLESYELDLSNVDEDLDLEVAGFSNAVVWIDYGAEGFPRSGAGNSMQWNGSGDFQSGENWAASEAGTARESVATSLEDLAINDTNDIGSPGVVLGSTDDFDSLAITEIMYNPASDEPAWEWIEVFNGSDAIIDFAAEPHFLDDKASADLSEANISTGMIEAGETAVLFSSAISADDMTTAWGEGNYIPVDAWSSLNNGGDLVAIWNDADEYAADGDGAGDRLADGAVFSVTYDDGDDDWPNAGQGNSISILDLAESADDGLNWTLSAEGDGDSVFANPVIASQPDHDGGDLGTPGTFGEVISNGLDLDNSGTVDADDAVLLCSSVGEGDVGEFLAANDRLVGDFDLNGKVEFADFLTLSGNFGKTENIHYGSGDANCQDGVDFADFLTLSSNFGKTTGEVAQSVPEPTTFGMWMFACLLLMSGYRRPRSGE